MYQSINNIPKEKIDELYNIFQKGFNNKIPIEIDNNKYDLNKVYRINWCCAWNNPNFLYKKCKIIAKNNKIAIVIIKDIPQTSENLLSRIFRLEDLNLIIKN